MSPNLPVGLTKDTCWQVGVSRRVPTELHRVWTTLTSPEGLAAWLGPGAAPDPQAGAPYEAADGTTGEMRSWRERDRLRATRLVPGEDHETTIQVTVSTTPTGTRIGLHQERMASQEERSRMRNHWKAVADELARVLAAG